MSESKYRFPIGTEMRLKPGSRTIHKAYGTHTVCSREITAEAAQWPEKGAGGTYCRTCMRRPVITFTYASGRQERYVVR